MHKEGECPERREIPKLLKLNVSSSDWENWCMRSEWKTNWPKEVLVDLVLFNVIFLKTEEMPLIECYVQNLGAKTRIERSKIQALYAN